MNMAGRRTRGLVFSALPYFRLSLKSLALCVKVYLLMIEETGRSNGSKNSRKVGKEDGRTGKGSENRKAVSMCDAYWESG